MLRRGSPWVRPWPAALVALGCAREMPPPTASSSPHPPGVAIDPETELPKAAASADTATGLAVLTEPVDPRVARKIIAAFFDAIIAESEAALEGLLVPGARLRASARARTEPALPAFHRRLERLDYRSLETELLYHPSAIETYTAFDVQALRDRPLALLPRSGEILVRIPMAGGRVSQFFGAEVSLLLKESAGRYAIADIVEDFRY